MTRGEAIKILEFERGYFCDFKECQEQQALTMAIKALEQKPCEDAISRQAVEEIINDIRDYISVEGYWAILERMKKLPSITPQPKTGHWHDKKMKIKGGHGYAYGRWGCSVCKKKFENKSNFCPNCGSKMESEEV